MSDFIIPIQSMPTISSITEKGGSTGAGKLNTGELPFADVLQNAIQAVGEGSGNSQSSMYDLAVGGTDDLHTGAVDALKYNTAVSYAAGITSSVIRAYNELMRMSI